MHLVPFKTVIVLLNNMLNFKMNVDSLSWNLCNLYLLPFFFPLVIYFPAVTIAGSYLDIIALVKKENKYCTANSLTFY